MYIQQFAGSLCLVILFFSSFTPTTRREAGANVNKLKLLPLPSYTEKNSDRRATIGVYKLRIKSILSKILHWT